MKSLKIEIDGKLRAFQIPDKFNELSESQYLNIIQFITMDSKSEHYEGVKLTTMLALLGFYDARKKERKSIFKIFDAIIEAELIDDLLQLIDFVKTEQDFTKFIIRDFKIGNYKLTGPSDRFQNMTFGKFIAVDMLATAYFSSRSDLILDKMIALLYSNETVRAKDIEYHLHDFDKNIKTAILYNYIGIRNWISKKYPLVFSSDSTSSRTNIQLGRQENNWLTVRRHISGNDVLKLSKVDELDAHETLRHLEEELKKAA